MVKKMNLIHGLIACGLMATFGCAKDQAPTLHGDINVVVAKHDKQLRAELGIGIVSTGIISQIGPDTYLLEDAMKSAEKKAYDELIHSGYVLAEKVNAKEGVFVRFQLTEKGMVLRDAIN